MKKTVLGALTALCALSTAQAETAIGAVVPRSPRAELIYQLAVGELAGRRGDLPMALAAYQTVLDQDADPKVLARATVIALFAKDLRALAFSQQWLAKEPTSPEAQRANLQARLRHGELDAALTADLIALVSPVDTQAGYGELLRNLRQAEPQKSLAVMTAVATTLNQPIAHYFRAVFAENAGDLPTALAALERAKETGANPQAVALFRARLLVDLQRAAEAVDELAAQVAAQPEERDVRLGYARLLVGQRRLDEALAQFEQLITANPQDADALLALGLLHSQKEDYATGEGYLQRLLTLDERRSQALMELGRLAERQGEWEQARQWYERIAATPEVDEQLLFDSRLRIGASWMQQGDLAAFNAYFDEIRRALPPPLVVNWTLAQVELLRSERVFETAFEVLTQQLAVDPTNTDLLYSRALVAERLDRLDILEQDLQQILQREPDNAQTLNALGYTWADRKQNLEQAFDYIQRAYAQLPEDAAVVDSMGWIHYRLGNHEEALSYLRRAYELDPQGEIAAHLVEVLFVMGDDAAAKALFAEAIERHPDDEFLNKLRGLFDL